MNFIRRIGRDEIYIKYVHQLVNVSDNVEVLHEVELIRIYRCICNLRIMLKPL